MFKSPLQQSRPTTRLVLACLLLLSRQTSVTAQGEGLTTNGNNGITNINVNTNNNNNSNNNNNADVIIVDGFVDTTTCYQHLVEADENGNNDGRLQADEFVTFAQLQTPGGQLDDIETYPEMPLVMQATFVTLTCLCRDERFGGDSQNVNCCLGKDAHIAIVGHDTDSSSQEKTRLFATCFLTDQAVVQVLGSDPPSSPPTDVPSAFPSTVAPTSAPTTPAPTIPTATLPPTFPPTTASPSTTAPTIAATTTTTTTPTVSPSTVSPSALDTSINFFTQQAMAVYLIAVQNGASQNIPASDYQGDLVAAMDRLATTVVVNVFASERRQRRQLQVKLQLPTTVVALEVTDCTEGLTNPNDRCENVQHSITLADTVELAPDEVSDFEVALFDAIARGELQDNLPPGSIVRILTGLTPVDAINTGAVQPEDDDLSGGATAGIVLAALIVTILPIALYLSMRRNQEEKEPYGAYEPHDVGSAEGMQGPEDEAMIDVESNNNKGRTIVTGTLGASPSDYGKSSYGKMKDVQQPVTIVHKVPPVSPEPDSPHHDEYHDIDHDSSSNAGSSGWSSSAGLSSLNTGSAEDSMDMLHSPVGSSLAAIGAASAVARRMENRRNISPTSGGVEDLDVPAGAVTRNDLDNAIEAGDWAAVGATAALLAAASDSQSASSRSRASRASRSQNTSVSSVDAARAAELDHLVDAGDWEGVVLAAAKFEAQEGSIRSGTASSVRSSSAGSADTRSGTGSGTFTPSVSTSISESPSKAKKRDEIRQEVEALVRRVVPEELDNVDEMMAQFKGREEELVETLRTMQERAVAQKARTAGHKAAKQEARRTVLRGGVPGAVPPSAPAPAPARASPSPPLDPPETISSRDGQSSASGSESTERSALRKRTALEQAIEAGDWEAVGEAAALMSDTSITSTSTAELERLAAGARLSSGAPGTSRSLRILGVNADRARELDEMIDRGDWAAVVEAAGRFNQADKEASSASSVDSPGKREIGMTGSSDSEAKRIKQLKEEEDALAQAEIWMQIAAQSKAEGATDAGASDAADWAIARSLKSLKNAEDQGEGGSTGDSRQGSHQSGGSDDESV